MNHYGVIYMLFDKINSKVYVGQTINFNNRMRNHKTDYHNDKIHNSIKKYGWDNFEQLILDKASNKEQLDVLECFYIEKFQSIEYGYNLKCGGSYGRHSEETKQKMKKPKSEKHKKNIAISKTGDKSPNFGKFGDKHHNFGKRWSNPSHSHFVISVKCNETNEIFKSINSCAKKMNLNRGCISEHLNGKRKHVKAFTFSLVCNH